MARNKLDNAQLEIYRDIADDVEESEYVPYACLYDPHTILTKNGELLQIIKVTGFTYESTHHGDDNLRNVIRRAICDGIPSSHYAVWFTTIRRKKRLSADGDYPDDFSANLHKVWKERNQWDRKFINELYVTIVREGQDADISSLKGFVNGIFPARDRAVRNQYLDDIAQELNETISKTLNILGSFGATRLGIVNRNGCYYGEHLEFLEKLINLEERPMPIEEIDLSQYLTSGEIAFAYNAMEVRSADGDRRFGAILTVKEYKEASLYRIDEFLQIPVEFIVTQCLDFVNAKQALSAYQEQYRHLTISGDMELADKSELSLIMRQNRQRDTDYGEQQTSIFIISDSVPELESNLRQIRTALSRIAVTTVREDLRFEECYWAQLPANFEFLSRLNYTNSQHVAGFVNIQNYPAGNAKGCPWGPPITLFYTAAGTPYFFNFHLQESGHTTIIGPSGSNIPVLLNFLISESRKYRTRLFYFDSTGSSERFIHAIGGSYYHVPDHMNAPQFCPLALPDSAINRGFLAQWMATLIDHTGLNITVELMGALTQAVDRLYQLPDQERRLSDVVSLLQASHGQSAQLLAQWCAGGSNASFFDHAIEAVQPRQGIIGFNVAALIDRPAILIPLVSYLLHRITMTMDGTPSIIVLTEGWTLLHNPIFASSIAQWLSYVTSKNGIVICTTENPEQAAAYPFTPAIMQMTETQIFMPDEDTPSAIYQRAFGLDEDEAAYVEAMSSEYRHFMLKRGQESIIAELNLGGLDEILSVLSCVVPEQRVGASSEIIAASERV